MTKTFKGHPVGVAKQLRKIRTRDERVQRCIVSLLCAMTDEDIEDARARLVPIRESRSEACRRSREKALKRLAATTEGARSEAA